jgi:hypothetical protein
MKCFYKYKLNYIAGIFKAMDSFKIADLVKGIKDQEWKNHHTCHNAYSIIVYILLIVVCSYIVYYTYQCMKPWLLYWTGMIEPLGETQLMENETGKCNNTGATIGTSSEDLAAPETILLQDSSQSSCQKMSIRTSAKPQQPKLYF